MPPWYALYTTNERRAAKALTEAGFEVFFPTYAKYVHHGRRKALEPRALLPGYVFARVSEGGFHAALTCEYVVRALPSYGDPIPAPEEAIADLIQLVQSGRMDERLPATRARPRGVRAKGLKALELWFEQQRQQPLALAA